MAAIAIIGAGLAGMTCARTLIAGARRLQVDVFDKGRGPGGRTSTRKTGDGFQFDHGAQYFTARDPDFRDVLEQWRDKDQAALWKPRFAVHPPGSADPDDDEARFVGTPGMNALAADDAVPVRYGVQIVEIERATGGWVLKTEQRVRYGHYDYVLFAIPAPQAVPLLSLAPELQARVSKARMGPCWAVMAGFDKPLDLPFDAVRVRDRPLAWAARDSAKPGRDETGEAWVLHAHTDWSSWHVDDDADAATAPLLEAFENLCKAHGADLPEPVYLRAHRWRYAKVVEPLGDAALWEPRLAFGACGDWCLGPRVEAAWLSGRALAEQVLSVIAEKS